MLVIEAMIVNFLEQGIGGETTLKLSCRNNLGTVLIEIAFEGKQAYLYSDEDGVFSPEDHILQAYEDKIDCSYYFGLNSFKINVKRKHLRSLLYCGAAVLLAIVTSVPLLSHFREAPTESVSLTVAAASFSQSLSEIIPSSIFDPFEVISPIPLIVLSLITAA